MTPDLMLIAMQYSPFIWGAMGGFFAYLVIFLKGFKNEKEESDVTLKEYSRDEWIFFIAYFMIGGVLTLGISLQASPIWQLFIGAGAVGLLSRFVNA
ncbi:MAG: hypothetical protein NTW33_02070 [Methanoregula sp.]|nr:hypothetical protein [Methanoregula sp.]